MGTVDKVVEIESLERGLLSDSGSSEEREAEDEPVPYAASFQEMEENFLKYLTVKWVLYSLLLILACGIGLFMLLYLPVRRYILWKEIRSRKLYLTSNSIVYKVTRPVPFPCFGVLKKEKHVLFPSVADVVIEQGYLQSVFGVYLLRIENVGLRKPPNDDVQILGIANPTAFKKLIPQSVDLALLEKLEEVGNSIKRVQTLIEEQHCQISEPIDCGNICCCNVSNSLVANRYLFRVVLFYLTYIVLKLWSKDKFLSLISDIRNKQEKKDHM